MHAYKSHRDACLVPFSLTIVEHVSSSRATIEDITFTKAHKKLQQTVSSLQMAGMSARFLTPPTYEDSQNSESLIAEPSLSFLSLNDSNTRPSTYTPTHKPRGRRFVVEVQHSKNMEYPFDLTNYPLRQNRMYEEMPPPRPNQRPSLQHIPQPSSLPAPRHPPTTYSNPNPNPFLPLSSLPTTGPPSPQNQTNALITQLITAKLVRSIHARLLLNPDTFGAQLLTPLQTLFHPHPDLALRALNSFPLPLGEKLRALSDNQKRLESQISLSKALACLEMLRILFLLPQAGAGAAAAAAMNSEMAFVVAKTEREVQEVLTRMCEHDAQERSKGDFMAVQEVLRGEMELELLEEEKKQEKTKKEIPGEDGVAMMMEGLLEGDGDSLHVNVDEDLAL
ncbi:hypothetical protein BST61_g4007 [Cercospora zeina]